MYFLREQQEQKPDRGIEGVHSGKNRLMGISVGSRQSEDEKVT